MRVLVLGHGKTGKLVSEVAAAHGHSVHVLDAKENRDAAALTAPFVTGFDAIIASLLYGTNYSVGVQLMMKFAGQMVSELKSAGYTFSIAETHHITKLDAPSGTALTLRDAVQAASGATDVPIESLRQGEAVGLHVLEAAGPGDRILLSHESQSRQAYAEGAVRAAEWLARTKPGVYDFKDIFGQI